MPLVSSSFELEGVERERRAEFSRLRDESGGFRAGALLAFHISHQPARGPYSPCMHREDAETVSFTWMTVTPLAVVAASLCLAIASDGKLFFPVPIPDPLLLILGKASATP